MYSMKPHDSGVLSAAQLEKSFSLCGPMIEAVELWNVMDVLF
jgi:hypothetical protein